MNSTLVLQFLLPVTVILSQAFLFTYAGLFVMRKLKMIKSPLNGMEYSQAIFASIIILSILLVSTASVSAMFQTFKTMQNQGGGFFRPYIEKSGQFFLIILAFEILLGLFIVIFTKSFPIIKNWLKDILEGSIPSSILISCIILGFAIALRIMAMEVLYYVIPQYLNFR